MTLACDEQYTLFTLLNIFAIGTFLNMDLCRTGSKSCMDFSINLLAFIKLHVRPSIKIEFRTAGLLEKKEKIYDRNKYTNEE